MINYNLLPPMMLVLRGLNLMEIPIQHSLQEIMVEKNLNSKDHISLV